MDHVQFSYLVTKQNFIYPISWPYCKYIDIDIIDIERNIETGIVVGIEIEKDVHTSTEIYRYTPCFSANILPLTIF